MLRIDGDWKFTPDPTETAYSTIQTQTTDLEKTPKKQEKAKKRQS